MNWLSENVIRKFDTSHEIKEAALRNEASKWKIVMTKFPASRKRRRLLDHLNFWSAKGFRTNGNLTVRKFHSSAMSKFQSFSVCSEHGVDFWTAVYQAFWHPKKLFFQYVGLQSRSSKILHENEKIVRSFSLGVVARKLPWWARIPEKTPKSANFTCFKPKTLLQNFHEFVKFASNCNFIQIHYGIAERNVEVWNTPENRWIS